MTATDGQFGSRLADRLSLREARVWDGRQWLKVRRERLVFTHVPKSGGTSFDSFLASFFRAEEILPPRLQILGPSHWTDEDWRSYRYFHGGHPLDEMGRLNDAHYVTLLRDPVQRIQSLYWHLRRTEDLSDQIPEKAGIRRVLRELAQSLSFEEWVRQPPTILGAYPRNVYVALLTGGYPLTVRASAAELLELGERAKQVLASQFTFFGFIERYAASKRLFCRTFGLPGHFALGEERYNVAPGRHRRQPPDPETLALIEAENAVDVALYRFAQQLFEERCQAAAERPPDELEEPRPLPRPRLRRGARGQLRIAAADLCGTGVHPEEVDETLRSHRWLGGDAGTQISLAVDLPAGAELTVRLSVSEVATDAAFTDLDVRFDGAVSRKNRHTGWFSGPEGLVYRAQFKVTREMACRPIHLLEIHCPWEVPSELPGESTDDRALSIAVLGVELQWQPFPSAVERLRRWVVRRWDRWQARRLRAA